MSEGGYDMVMPFVSVASKGGPFDDDSYVCGYEMGMLDEALRRRRNQSMRLAIHTMNRDQADLIAMRRGYTMSVINEGDGWSLVTFLPGKDG